LKFNAFISFNSRLTKRQYLTKRQGTDLDYFIFFENIPSFPLFHHYIDYASKIDQSFLGHVSFSKDDLNASGARGYNKAKN
jgi:hypothetical protein